MNTIESTYDTLSLISEDAEKQSVENTIPDRRNVADGCPDSLFVKDQDYFRRVPFNSILYIEASGGCCIFHLLSEVRIEVTCTLAEVIRHLPQPFFLQVHRSFIINASHIETYIGNMFIVGTEMIPIGRAFKKEALSHLNILGMV